MGDHLKNNSWAESHSFKTHTPHGSVWLIPLGQTHVTQNHQHWFTLSRSNTLSLSLCHTLFSPILTQIHIHMQQCFKRWLPGETAVTAKPRINLQSSVVTLLTANHNSRLPCPFIKKPHCTLHAVWYCINPPPSIRSVHSCPLLLSRSGLCYLCQMQGGETQRDWSGEEVVPLYEKRAYWPQRTVFNHMVTPHISIKTLPNETLSDK